MSKQHRQALNSLDATQSPFVETRTQKIFKNVANLNLRGATYDARHLDSFLGSGYGDKSFNPERIDRAKASNYQNAPGEQPISDLEASVARNRSIHAHLPSYLVNSQAIKPSTSFLNIDREHQVFNQYVDLYDGPSGIQKRLDIPTLQERNSHLVFETERKSHIAASTQNIDQLNSARSKLYNDASPKLRYPSQARQEIAEVRDALKSYKAFKTEHSFLTKRDRLMKTAWKHGVFGVDDADSKTT